MPIFKAKLSDGRTVTLEGDHKPTEEEVLSAVQGFKPDKAPAPQSLEPPEDETLRSVREAFAPIESERQRQRTFPAYLQEHLLEPVNRALEFSPADIANAPRNYPEAVASEILKQVNLPNVGLITGAGAIAKVPGVAADVAKAAIGSLFAKQMTEAGAQAAGKRLAGIPLTPEEKGALDVQIGLGALPAAGVVAAPKLLKGKDYASRIESTEPVSELEVRPRMGEEAPLRQQPQELAQAREPVRQEPQQGTEVPQEKVVATPLTPEEQVIEQARLAESEQGTKTGAKPATVQWDKLYDQEHNALIDLQKQMEQSKEDGDYAAEKLAKQERDDILQRLDQFDSLSKRTIDYSKNPTASALRDNPQLTLSEAISEGQRKIQEKKSDDIYDAAIDSGMSKKQARKLVSESNKAVAPLAQPPTPSPVLPEGTLEKTVPATTETVPTISVTPKTGKTQAPLEILNSAKQVKVTAPKSATMVRVTDSKGKTATQSLASVQGENVFQGAGITKIEAGIIGKDKKFKPVKGEVTVEDKTPQKFPIGPGAMTATEFETNPNSPTSIKNKQVDVERQARGLPPAIQTVRRSFGRTWDDAMAKIDRDPGYPDRLIDELKSHPRAVNEIEDAVLLHRQIDLQNEYGKTTRDLAQAYEDSKEFPNRLDDVEELKVRTAVLSDKLLELYDINKFVGTETARGLSARRMMAYEDFTLAKMELDKRTANGGRPLTEKERLDVQKLHDQIAALQKRYDDYVAKTEAKMAELALKQAVSDIEKQPRASKGADIAALKQVAVNQITKKIKDGKKGEITNAVQRLARLFVQEGVRDRNILIDRVHEVLKQIDPEITRRETMDAISGYGDYRQLSKDEVSVELRTLKGQMQQVAKLEDMQAGRPPLKTGTERRAVSPEESRLIRLVNDAKRKFQIPIEDPNTQLRSSLDELKKRMQTRIDDLNERLAKHDFTTKKREPIKLDAVASQLKADLSRAKQKFMRGLIEDRMKRRPWWVKAQDTFLRWYRGGILSSPVVFAKLTAAAIIRAALTPLEEVTGAGISKALPKLAARAPREGYFNSRAEAKAILSQLTKGPKTAWQVLKTGEQDIDVLYGKGREGAIGEMQVRPFSVADIPGRTHAALKASTKQAEFERSLEKRLDFAIRNGIDASSPAVQLEAAVEAYKDGQRSIFLQDNRVVSAYNRALRALEEPSKVTGKPPIGSKTVATAARTLVPIVRVPSNIVAEAFQFATGSVTGSARFGMAVRRGIENLPPEQADLIMRELKKGSIGAAAILVGFLLPELWGGYYERGEKRKPTEIKPSQARIPGIAFPTVLGGPDVPQSLLHHPIFETIQAGATIRRISDKNTKDGNNGIPVGVKAAALGLIEETPFVKEMIDTAKAFNPSEQNAYFGELAKSIAEPQIVQWLAKQGDTDAAGQVIARKPKTVTQHLEMGIPGLRQNVPPKVVPATGVTW